MLANLNIAVKIVHLTHRHVKWIKPSARRYDQQTLADRQVDFMNIPVWKYYYMNAIPTFSVNIIYTFSLKIATYR